MKLVKRLGLGHLIKRLRINKDGTQDIELEARVPALVKLGEHYNLWKGEAQSQLTLVELAKGLKEQYEQLEVKNEMIHLLKRCRDRPELFNKLFLNRPAYWSRQIDLCRSVVEYRTTVAYSGNMVGKDYWIAGIIIWWLLTRPDSLCIITGPSQMVLGSVTFKEIRRCLDGAVIPFGGKLSSGLKASPAVIEVAPGWQALGFSTTSVERSSGQHAKHLLTVVEEASGVEDFVFDAIDSLGYERLVCIGNPIRAEGKFVDLIRQAARDRADNVPPRLAVNAIRIPSTESPHAHEEKSEFGLADRTWLESMYRKYGRHPSGSDRTSTPAYPMSTPNN